MATSPGRKNPRRDESSSPIRRTTGRRDTRQEGGQPRHRHSAPPRCWRHIGDSWQHDNYPFHPDHHEFLGTHPARSSRTYMHINGCVTAAGHRSGTPTTGSRGIQLPTGRTHLPGPHTEPSRLRRVVRVCTKGDHTVFGSVTTPQRWRRTSPVGTCPCWPRREPRNPFPGRRVSVSS